MEKLLVDYLVQIFPYVVEPAFYYHVHTSPQLVCLDSDECGPPNLTLFLQYPFSKLSCYLCLNIF